MEQVPGPSAQVAFRPEEQVWALPWAVKPYLSDVVVYQKVPYHLQSEGVVRQDLTPDFLTYDSRCLLLCLCEGTFSTVNVFCSFLVVAF